MNNINHNFMNKEPQPVKKRRNPFVTEHGDIKTPAVIGAVVGTIVLLIVGIGVITEFFQIVPPAHKGLVIIGGELQQEVLGDGFHTKIPFWTEIVPVYVGTISTDEDIKGNFREENPFRSIQPLSKDGQVLDIDAQINYNIIDPVVFRERTNSTDPRTVEQLLFIPMVRRLVYDYAAEYTWKGLIQEGDRQEFGQRIFRAMALGEVTKRVCKEETRVIDEITGTETIIEAGCELIDLESISNVSEYGVTITAINFKKIRPNAKIIAAVEEAQAKEQEVKIAQQEAAIATEVANKAIEIKRGETESIKLEADASAYRLRVEKEEEAKGIEALARAEKLRAQALASSQQLVQYRRLEIELLEAQALIEFGKNWSGAVPTTITIVGTDEAAGMNLFLGMTPTVVANP